MSSSTAQVLELLRYRTGEPAIDRRGKRALRLFSTLLVLGIGAGLVAAVRGHHVMGTTSEMSWGLLIAMYLFLAVASTGVSLVAALGHVEGFERFARLEQRATWLAWVLLALGFGVIAAELERPLLLAKLVLLSPHPRSPIWWMGTLYGFYFTLLSAQLFLLLRHDHERAGKVAIPKLLFGVAASSNLGAVFALSHARPYWHGPFVPVYLILTALVCGASLLSLVVWFGELFGNQGKVRAENQQLLESLGKLLVLFLALQALATAWRMIAGVAGTQYGLAEVVQAQLSGPLFFSFWFFEVFVGMAVPLVLLLSPRRREPKLLALAASLPVIAMTVVRYNFVQAGQMFSLKPLTGRMGEVLSYAPPFKGNVAGFLPYTPSLVEVLIALGAVSGVITLFVLGARALRLDQEA